MHLHDANVEGADFTGVNLGTVSLNYANLSKPKYVDIPSGKSHIR